jgi:hypothetical protein
LDKEDIGMPEQDAYVPQTGPLQNCLSVIVDVQPGHKVEIECTQLKQKGKRDVVSFDSLKPACFWDLSEGDVGLTRAQVYRKLGKSISTELEDIQSST